MRTVRVPQGLFARTIAVLEASLLALDDALSLLASVDLRSHGVTRGLAKFRSELADLIVNLHEAERASTAAEENTLAPAGPPSELPTMPRAAAIPVFDAEPITERVPEAAPRRPT